MPFDVYADLDHLFMLNFSMDAEQLAKLVPAPLTVLQKNGVGFPSIVLPSIKRLRPVITRFPRVDYELFGLRILVEYESQRLGLVKGIYFAKLIMDPNRVRLFANRLTPFVFERGSIAKQRQPDGSYTVEVRDESGKVAVSARVRAEKDFPNVLTPESVFESSDEALAMYNDIAYGFLPFEGGTEVRILQIADPYPNYVAWPLTELTVDSVRVDILRQNPLFDGAGVTAEPSYHVGFLPRYWRWLATEYRA